MHYDGTEALVGCVVYPDLHQLVFGNLHRLVLADVFVVPTYPMVLASRTGTTPQIVSTHPAPQGLVPRGVRTRLTTSNARAASDCATGHSDACVTTSVAAERHGLVILRDHGPVPMGFTVHVGLPERQARR